MLGRDVTPENAGCVGPIEYYSEFHEVHNTISLRLNKPLLWFEFFGATFLGSTTVVTLQLKSGSVIGVSRCSAQDTYNRMLGFKLAASRAIRKAYELKADSL